MKTKNFILVSVLILILSFNIKAQKMTFYKTHWEKIDSLEKKGLPKSALKVIEEIYTKAKSDNNSEQVIKSFIYNLKYKNQIEENAFEHLCKELDSTAQKASFPDNAVMQSMLAEMYWWYYTSNQYKFHKRTNTVNFDNTDMQTWTLDFLVGKIIKAYHASVSDPEQLKKIPISDYKELIIPGNAPKNLRPTLYDFLANKAIDFFSSPEISLTKPADNFELKEAYYFNDAKTYAHHEISSSDFLSLHFHGICLLQDLLKFRLSDTKNKDALINADLKRLRFVYRFSVNPKKDELYMNALKNLEQKYSSLEYSSKVTFRIAALYNSLSSKYNPQNKDTEKYKFYKEKALEICNSIIKKYPKSYAAQKAKALSITIQLHNLSIETEKIIPSNSKFSAKINFRNINQIHIRIAKIGRKKYIELKEKYYGNEFYDKIFNNSVTVKQFSQKIPNDGDFNQHSFELLNNGLNVGFYLIFISDNEKFTYEKGLATYKDITVSDISYISEKQDDGSQTLWVLNRKTGKAIPGVKCKVWKRKYSYSLRKYIRTVKGTYTTDKDGVFKIPAEENRSYNSWFVDFAYGKDFLSSAGSFYMYRYDKNNKKQQHTYFFTDRAIYRPGQTVYFKGISILSGPNTNKILTGKDETVYLYDVNSQKVSELKLTTNEFGTFSGTFTLPQGLLNGQFRIQSANGSKYISVEEYKRPKFEVKMLPFKGNYLLKETVHAEGEAKSYSGAVLSDATVKYQIIRTPKWRAWWFWKFNAQPTEIKNGTTKTDDTGKFKIDFEALPDLSMPENEFTFFSFQIIADVTDINGETQSTSSFIQIGYRTLQVSIPVSGTIDKDIAEFNKDENFIYTINTKNLNEEFVPVEGEIKIFKQKDNPILLRNKLWQSTDKQIYTKDEWYKLFPENVFTEENLQQNLKKGEQVFMTKFNTGKDKKLNLSMLKNLKNGYYVLEITSEDAFGNPVSNKQFFSITSHRSKKTAYKTPSFFKPLKINCEPGESAAFLIGSSYKNVNLIYQIEEKEKIIKTEYLKLNDEQKLITIPVTEEDRGNFAVHFAFIKDNRIYNYSSTVIVPYSNKKLDIEFMTFRDKLYPGQKEEWKIKIKGPKGEKVASEMLATLYDASLDQFKKNSWNFNIYNSYYSSRYFTTETFTSSHSQLLKQHLDENIYTEARYYDKFNWFGFSYGYYRYYLGRVIDYLYDTNIEGVTASGGFKRKKKKLSHAVTEVNNEQSKNREFSKEHEGNTGGAIDKDEGITGEKGKNEDFSNVKIRTNFNETAFFYPHLKTNEKGEVIISFTVPESLTKWKMVGFATSKDLKYGFINEELITQKDLMLIPNAPRFFRENDTITFPVKISNISEKDLSGNVILEFFDALSMKPINIFISGEEAKKKFYVKAGGNTLTSWELAIPEGISAITYKVVAKAGKFSDGEQKPLPVLTNRILVTESLPLPIRGKETKTFKFKKLINSGSSTSIRNHKLTLEFTSNPAWYAVQALPYLMEYPYECTEQIFSRFYANSIASHIANSNPKIKRVFDSWKQTDAAALISNLEKNQELKTVLLEETPWVLQGKNESERKKRIGLLFDFNKMSNELNIALRKIQKTQKSNGAWPWFNGMPESRYITQHIVTGMGHLDKLGVKSVRQDAKTWNMLQKAVGYLDVKIKEDYNQLKKYYSQKELQQNHLSYTAIQYLYGRSYFDDIPIPKRSQEAYNYYFSQAKRYWLSQSKYMQGMIALALFRKGEKEVPADIVKSLKEKSINHEELGMYWKDNVAGWYWFQAPIEQQALMIEVFDEVANDLQSVNDMKIWLLKQKQTQDWKTTKATTEAVYALLMQGNDWLASDIPIEIKIAGKKFDPKQHEDVKIEAGTGYFKTSWSGKEIKPEMGNITIKKSDEGVSWGAMYWQYFEDLDKITPHETPMKLKKQLFIEKLTERGKIIEPISEKVRLKIGDKVIVRIELRVDRRMEYIHMKDMRASGFEPINVISRYKYQDGLGYYESTKDASTNFFMEALPKGTYVFEYPLRVIHEGKFSNGITTIQCMYAPEFTAHSEGIRLKVDK